MFSWLLSDTTYYVGGILLGLAGLSFLITGMCGRKPKKPTCRKCRYDMSAASSLTCSECGCVHRNAQQLLKRPVRLRRIALSLLLIAFVCYAHFWPEVKHRQAAFKEPWHLSIVPTTAWIMMLPTLSDEDWRLFSKRLDFERREYVTIKYWRNSGSFCGGSMSFETKVPLLPRWQLWLLARACNQILLDPTAREHRREAALDWAWAASERVDSANETLCTALHNSAPQVRHRAVHMLHTNAPLAAFALPQLSAMLNDPDPNLTLEVAHAMLEIRCQADALRPAEREAFDQARTQIHAILEGRLSSFLSREFSDRVCAYMPTDPVLVRLVVLRTAIEGKPYTAWGKATVEHLGEDFSAWAELMPFILDKLLHKTDDIPSEYERPILAIGAIREEDKPLVRRLLAEAKGYRRTILLEAFAKLDARSADLLSFLARDPARDIAESALYTLQEKRIYTRDSIMAMATAAFDRTDLIPWTVDEILEGLSEAPPELLALLNSHLLDPRPRARQMAAAGLNRWATHRGPTASTTPSSVP
ncbi:MAG: hypothetical protein WD768_14370 [Phycisphaeraceae bacterium]